LCRDTGFQLNPFPYRTLCETEQLHEKWLRHRHFFVADMAQSLPTMVNADLTN
jgi:hypothetical protein